MVGLLVPGLVVDEGKSIRATNPPPVTNELMGHKGLAHRSSVVLVDSLLQKCYYC